MPIREPYLPVAPNSQSCTWSGQSDMETAIASSMEQGKLNCSVRSFQITNMLSRGTHLCMIPNVPFPTLQSFLQSASFQKQTARGYQYCGPANVRRSAEYR